jgi:hypothetical protein
MFGLVAVAAVAAMAFIGASSAMAESTVLCSTTENPCASHGADEYARGGKVRLPLPGEALFPATYTIVLPNPVHIEN